MIKTNNASLMTDCPKPTSDILRAVIPFACNIEDETHGAMTAQCLQIRDGAAMRHRYGSSTFRYLQDGHYTEKTIQLPGVVTEESEKFNVKFDIPRVGDIAHTFVLRAIDDEAFDDYVLSADRPKYHESMTLKVNNILARAAGWPVDNGVVPLMIRETVDFRQCYLPLLAVYGIEGVESQTQQLTLRGFRDKALAKSCVLEVNYCYLDRPTRIHLAQNKAGVMPMAICNYVTQKVSLDFKDSHVLECELAHPIRVVNTATGLLISGKSLAGLKKVEFSVNGYVLARGDKSSIAWKKVGLEAPEGDTILLAFSRNMWTNVEEAAFVDFSRIDSLNLTFYSEEDFSEKMVIDVTALAYTTRTLTNSSVHDLIGSD